MAVNSGPIRAQVRAVALVKRVEQNKAPEADHRADQAKAAADRKADNAKAAYLPGAHATTATKAHLDRSPDGAPSAKSA